MVIQNDSNVCLSGSVNETVCEASQYEEAVEDGRSEPVIWDLNYREAAIYLQVNAHSFLKHVGSLFRYMIIFCCSCLWWWWYNKNKHMTCVEAITLASISVCCPN
jgi:hypothetical protein